MDSIDKYMELIFEALQLWIEGAKNQLKDWRDCEDFAQAQRLWEEDEREMEKQVIVGYDWDFQVGNV